jgi:hypothetical protein
MAGADVANYNGAKTITVVDADTFTYTVSNSGATPATGTITATGADQAVYNDTTLTDDTELTIPVSASTHWVVDFDLFYSNTDDTTDGMSVSVTAPSGSVGYFTTKSPDLVAIPAIALGTGVALGSDTLDATIKRRHVQAIVDVGATAGNITLQFAQTTGASATQAVIYAGSRVSATQEFTTLVV